MADKVIGRGFIDIVTRGVAKAFSDIKQIKGALVQVATAANEQFNKVGSFAQKAFAGLAASIFATVRVADPKGFQDFTFSLQRLALHIGRTFIPLLHSLTNWIMRVGDFFAGLTPKQRETVLWFGKIAVGVLLVAAVVPKLTAAIGGGVMVVKGLVAAFNVFLASNPAGWLLTLVSLIGAAVAGLGLFIGVLSQTEGGSKALGRIWEVISNIFKVFWLLVQPIFEALLHQFNNVMDIAGALADTLTQAFGYNVVAAFERATATMTNLLKGMFDWLSKALEYAVKGFLALSVVIGRVMSGRILHGGLFAEMNAAFKKFDANLAKAKADREAKDNFAGSPIAAAPQFMAITEAFRRAQQSTVQTPEQRLMQEQLQVARDGNRLGQQIVDNTRPKGEVAAGAKR